MQGIMEILYSGSLFILTEMAGISHVAVNYPYIMKKGFRWFADESRRKMEEIEREGVCDSERFAFYKASEIVSQAIAEYGLRYAELSMKMAEEEENEQRREELMKIAEICKKVPVALY